VINSLKLYNHTGFFTIDLGLEFLENESLMLVGDTSIFKLEKTKIKYKNLKYKVWLCKCIIRFPIVSCACHSSYL
jgi:hypothetical protein